jgi:peptidylprolyl isomerase
MTRERGVGAGWALLLALAVLCGAAVGAGCGGDDASGGGATTSGRDATTDQPPTEPGQPVPTESGADAAKRAEPKVYVPDGPPPAKVAVEDMIQGSGPAAKVGDELTVNFIAVRYTGGEFFESSWDWPKPFTFELGMKDVIPGWVKGLPGMREGGRRHLVIPGKFAARGGVSLLPEAEENSLVYVVDLIKVD